MSSGVTPLEAETVAVVIVRDGRVPDGADEVVAEAGGRVVLVGRDPVSVAGDLPSAVQVWAVESPTTPAAVAHLLAPLLSATRLVILPASPDGRDVAPRLASVLRRPLLAAAISSSVKSGQVHAELLRVDGQVVVAATVDGPAVATLLPGARNSCLAAGAPTVSAISPSPHALTAPPPDAELVTTTEPDPATMELAEAKRVVGGGAGLADRQASDQANGDMFALMGQVAAALGASAGATRVVTDAGWMGYDRQIGTTGVNVEPDLYIALGVSGASQHLGGLGSPKLTVSVNSDPSCPMTAMADLGLVTDARGLLIELARRFGLLKATDQDGADL